MSIQKDSESKTKKPHVHLNQFGQETPLIISFPLTAPIHLDQSYWLIQNLSGTKAATHVIGLALVACHHCSRSYQQVDGNTLLDALMAKLNGSRTDIRTQPWVPIKWFVHPAGELQQFILQLWKVRRHPRVAGFQTCKLGQWQENVQWKFCPTGFDCWNARC